MPGRCGGVCISDNLLPFVGKVIIISGQRYAYVMNGRLNGLRLRNIFLVIPLDTLRFNFCFPFSVFISAIILASNLWL